MFQGFRQILFERFRLPSFPISRQQSVYGSDSVKIMAGGHRLGFRFERREIDAGHPAVGARHQQLGGTIGMGAKGGGTREHLADQAVGKVIMWAGHCKTSLPL